MGEEKDKPKMMFQIEYQDTKLTVRVQDLKDTEFFIDQTCETNIPFPAKVAQNEKIEK